jgi:CTP:molybdopterin cytidylyltransferase MocA
MPPSKREFSLPPSLTKMAERIPLGDYTVGEGHRFRLSAEVRESDGMLVVAIFAAPADAPDAPLTNEERARYSIWLTRLGDQPWVPVDHAQGLATVAERDGEPYLYWHGKAPGLRPFI